MNDLYFHPHAAEDGHWHPTCYIYIYIFFLYLVSRQHQSAALVRSTRTANAVILSHCAWKFIFMRFYYATLMNITIAHTSLRRMQQQANSIKPCEELRKHNLTIVFQML